jgi:type IV pilus assembly protein PilB
MGIQAFAVATSINLITGQRLCRKLHPDYRVKIDMPKEALVKEGFSEEWIEKGITVYGAGDGGSECPSGYKGRAGIYQVLPISEAMKRLIIEGANAVQLADQALKEGIWDLRTSGLKKVADGITSLAEVNRVTIE